VKQKRTQPLFHSIKSDQIDPVEGVIKGVVILQSGIDKYGEHFDDVSLSQLSTLGNEQAHGVKVRNGHPNMCDSSLGSFIGRYKNFTITKNADDLPVVVADLYLDKEACKTSPKGNPYDHIVTMAQKNNDMFGNSIVYRPAKEEVKIVTDKDGNEKTIAYQRFDSFIASDLVDSPAATTSLFKDENDFAANATLYLNENPEIFELLDKKPEVLKEFLGKYKSYNKIKMTEQKKKDTSFKSWLTNLFKDDEKAYDAQDASGATISISDEDGDGTPSVGDKVSNADGAMASAKIAMQDGTTINTDENGVITSIDPKAEATPTPEPSKSFDELKSAFELEVAEHKSDNEIAQKAIEGLNKKLKEKTEALAKFKSDFKPETSGTQFPAPTEEKKAADYIKEINDKKANK
jgi:hypothetical protein